MIDGLLIIDKPPGPTSHDVVARMRRVLREQRIGHTGTLDPLASGVLPLVLGRATRLARFLSASDKTYDARVRLGIATDTADSEGTPLGATHAGPLPAHADIERAIEPFRGTFLQQPPAHSAKKIAGVRSYELAREKRGGRPEPVEVTVRAIEILSVEGDVLCLRVTASAGFYVRALAHDLGERLGIGAHLVGLRRTRAAGYGLDAAIPLADAERDPAAAANAVVPMGRMLPHLPTVTLPSDEVRRVMCGRDIPGPQSAVVRLLDEGGDLVGVAEPAPTPGLLHPSVILR